MPGPPDLKSVGFEQYVVVPPPEDTVRVSDVLLVIPPPVPTIVITEVPVVAELEAERVRVLELLVEVGLKLADTPLGRPLTERETELEKPPVAET